MKPSRILIIIAICLSLGALAAGVGKDSSDSDLKNGIIACSQEQIDANDPDNLVPVSQDLVCFQGYISNFSAWHESGARSHIDEWWGVPHWTIHRVQASASGVEALEGRERPRRWYTVPGLQKDGHAPEDSDYATTELFRQHHPNWYQRGHLTQKYLTERLGPTAGWYTHNVANSVPQLKKFNEGPWQALECYTGAWANENREVWIITGPVFLRGQPSDWLRSDSKRHPFPIAISEAIFKIVARKIDGKWDAIAFLYPQDSPSYSKGPWPPVRWLTSVQRIEMLSGVSFSPDLHALGEARDSPGRIWQVRKESFDRVCKKFAEVIQ